MASHVDVVTGGMVEQPVLWPLLHDVDSLRVSGEQVVPGDVQLDVGVVVVPPVGVVTGGGGVTQIVGAQVSPVDVPLVVGEHVVPGGAQVGV